MTEARELDDVYVVEMGATGHRMAFVKMVIEQALAEGRRPILVTEPETVDSVEFKIALSSLQDQFQIRTYALNDGNFLKNLIVGAGRHRVVFMHGDRHLVGLLKLKAAGLLRSTVTVLITRDPLWSDRSTWKLRIKAKMKSVVIKLIASGKDGPRVAWLAGLKVDAKANKETGGRIEAVDPFISSVSVEEVQKTALEFRRAHLDPEYHWFMMAGAITPIKNLPMILESLEAVRRERPDRAVGLAIIGKLQDDRVSQQALERITQRAGIRLFQQDRILSNDELNVAVASADAIVIAYSTEASLSSMLVKAAILHRPFIVASPPLLQRFAKDLGAICSGDLTSATLTAGMLVALDGEAPPPIDKVPTPESFYRALVPRI